MEISLYHASNLPHMQTFGKVLGNFHVSCNEINIWQGTWKFPCTLRWNIWQGTCREISMYLATKDIMTGYMEISMYLATKDMAGYMEISIPCHVSLQGTWKFPCTFSVVLGESTLKFPRTSVSVLPKETWKFPYTCILVEKYIEEIYWAHITVKYPFNIVLFMTVYTADWQTHPKLNS